VLLISDYRRSRRLLLQRCVPATVQPPRAVGVLVGCSGVGVLVGCSGVGVDVGVAVSTAGGAGVSVAGAGGWPRLSTKLDSADFGLAELPF